MSSSIVTKRKDLIHPELSYKLVGILFDVFNTLGYRYQEKYYQRAIAQSLAEAGIPYKEQAYSPIEFKGKNIGYYLFDFLIDDKIVLEVKRGDRFSRNDIVQTIAYLKKSNISLGILARFSSNGIKYKRIINEPNSYVSKNS